MQGNNLPNYQKGFEPNKVENKIIKESEKVLERRLVKWVKEAKGEAFKLGSQYHKGLPDRMVLLPEGKIFFCEVKSTGVKPRPTQLIVHKILRKLGFRVYVVDSSETLSLMLRTELI